ncbi:Stf0 family sulfotransferase [Microbulbifer sp. EKSA008]|uniref:Stf0 family sulfotransferase n=1 Tax=unclassified Microbulbifer TaxID=2619833 RepID=UPI004039CAE6
MSIIEKFRKGIGSSRYRRFIVLTRSRTGSNLLISLLNSHPQIEADGEIFSKLNGKNYKTVLSKAFPKQPLNIKAKGFKIFYYHPQDDHSCGIWEKLKSMNDLHVIHLKRENILRTLISRKVAGVQDVWAIKSDQASSTPSKEVSVSFTEDELRAEFKRTRDWEENGENNFKNHPLLSITYEELVNNRSGTFRKITEFLDVQHIEPKTRLKKQNTKTLRESIKNYDELKSEFSKTEWAPFFED